MKPREITARRLDNLGITTPFASADTAVTALGAVQAQDQPSAVWAIALRTAAGTRAEVDRAIRDRRIVRTWPMRGTLHYVAADDVRWMLALTWPRMEPTMRRRAEQLAIDASAFVKAEKLLVKHMRGKPPLRRDVVLALVGERLGIAESNRRANVVCQLAMRGIVCFGPHEGKEPTFALVDEWAPGARVLERDVSLATIAERYFTSHGPATLLDFVWWTGLTRGEARAAVDLARPRLVQVDVDGAAYFMPDRPSAVRPSAQLLPAFDEYLLGYVDRRASLDPAHAPRVVPGQNGMFLRTAVVNGRVVGTWKSVRSRAAETVTIEPFAPFAASARAAITRASTPYATFAGTSVKIAFG